ncbi:MAG: hypothetical protein H0T46_22280 [Deltaproteobacteria bacterium]|nr:hypothetical protein [Deltaproteobacteria bacterium]
MAKNPSPSDGRIPCPQCGGLVHPIAGRCKHCKADLAEARGARPAAAAALPALAGSGTARPPVKADATPVPKKPGPAKAVAAAADVTDQILPPRESARMPAQKSGNSLLKNWPVLVIILAGIAIAVAVVLMVWPPSSTAKADTRVPPPPAPERMDTNPMPPKGSMITPPSAPNGVDPWAKPDDLAQIDPDDPTLDPLRPNPGVPSIQQGPFGSTAAGLAMSMLEHACTRMTACGNSQVAQACQIATQGMRLLGTPQPPTCAAAQRCLARIDQFDCNATLSPDAMLALFGTYQDCTEAARC